MEENRTPEEINEAHEYEPLNLLDLFFRPRKFFERTVKKGKMSYLLIATFIYGLASAIDRFDFQLMRSGSGRSELFADLAQNWAAFWAAVFFLGLISSFLVWIFGGWWYRKRLQFAGADEPDIIEARYVYIYSSFIYSAPYLLLTIIYTFTFESYYQAYHSEELWSTLLLLFLFGSLFTSYRGATTVFSLSKWKARVWFIILPAIFYIFTIGVFGFLFNMIENEKFISDQVIGEERIVAAADSSFFVKLPEEWSKLQGISPGALLEAGRPDEGPLVMVDYTDRDSSALIPLQELAGIVASNYMMELGGGTVDTFATINGLNYNYAARNMNLNFEGEEQSIVLIILEGKTRFYSITSYMGNQITPEKEMELIEFLRSFEEMEKR